MSSEMCCFVLKLDLGCLLIGILSLIVSLGMSIASMTMLSVEENMQFMFMYNRTEHLLGLFHLDVNQKSKELVLGIILFLAIVSTLSSAVLIIGVKKRIAGWVLSFFAYGIFLTFFMSLSSLLLLLRGSWWIAIALASASLFQIHFLVAVNTFYELLTSGEVEQTLDRQDFDDEDQLIESESPA